ncbi:MAG TPA: carboxypeptidase regulatory-like domain-containing protein [Candidatus Limnocylindria bacterium]|nr:carboxypeptidase regulatory-like domain-containing protein [Candidatus Limnocylindria bacterium]
MFRFAPSIRFMVPILGITLLHSCALLRAQSSPPDRSATPDTKFKIAGTIVSSLTGTPLGKARVSLFDIGNPANVVWMITAENGHFEFSSLKPGKFSLQGAKRGFIRAAYEQHEQFSTAIVTGAGFDTGNLVLRLTPLALLGGKVIDEWGDPVRNARVMLYVENHQAGMNRITPAGGGSTDDQGSYEFATLTPGNYYLSVAAKPWYAVHPVSSPGEGAGNSPPGVARSLDVAYPTTYYNGATDTDGATAISIQGGDHLQADIHVNPVPALHLVFHVPNDGQQGFSMPVFQKRVFDSMEYVQSEGAQSVAPGVYELTGVPAGRYSVRLQEPKSGQLQQSSEMNLVKDGQELDTSRSEPTATVKLSVQMPRQEPFPKQFSLALQDSRRQTVAFKSVGVAGEATFEDIPAGKYTILVFSPTKPYSVARAWSEGVEISGHELNVTPGASLNLAVFLVGGVVTVEGFAKRGDKPVAGVMVALVPKDPESHLEMFRRDQSDFDGSFVLRGVIPGLYTIVAVEDAWGFQWMQPGVLGRYVQHGQNLTIGELMKGSVHLPDPVEVQPR